MRINRKLLSEKSKEIWNLSPMPAVEVSGFFRGKILKAESGIIIFLPGFYKTAYNVGKPMILGILASTVFAIAANVAVMLVPVLNTSLNGLGTANFACQLPVLLAGIAIFVLLTWLSYKISANHFEKVDL